ncbi:MAG: hypothetical protein HOY69_36265 [Streptomyces sp.]|nr:hypothetical protein [Streptomyces sp.]
MRSAVEALCAEGELPLGRSLGRQLPELVALLDGLGLPELSGTLLDHVVSCLRRQPGLLVTLAPALDRLAVALAAHGRHEEAAWVSAASVESGTESAAALANLAALALRRYDSAGAAELAVEARRSMARTGDEGADTAEGLEVAVLETAVVAEAARREGLHAQADGLVDELGGYVRRLARLVGDDHPASLSALAALGSAEFSSAGAAGERARMERAADVLAVAAQRMSARLGGHHPRALSVLRSLAAAEYELARTSGDDRRLAGAEALMAAARRTEERPRQGVRRDAGSGARTGRDGSELTTRAGALISETEHLLAGEQLSSVLRDADSVEARRQFTAVQAQLARARALVDDQPGTASALALDALRRLDELARSLDARTPADDALNSPRRPAP